MSLVEMRSSGWSLIQCDRCAYKKGRGNLDMDQICTQGGHHMKMKTDIGDASTSEGVPKVTSKLPEAGRDDPSSHPSEVIDSVNTLILDSSFQNCETMNICSVSHQVCGTLLW